MDRHVTAELEAFSTKYQSNGLAFARTSTLIKRKPWRNDPEVLLECWRWSRGRSMWCYMTADHLPRSEYAKAADLNKQARGFEGMASAFKYAAGELLLGPGGGNEVLTYVNYIPLETKSFRDSSGVWREVTEDVWARFNPRLIVPVAPDSH